MTTPRSTISPILGCIADDFTGATDLASNLVEAGMNVVQCFGIPRSREVIANADAVVIALKIRSVDFGEAIARSLEALFALQSLGASRFYFKYSSTFDSTNQGNIGPVAEALMRGLKVTQTIFCPAFPENARTVYNGHLFVGDCLLNESGMKHHPLTPMTDANLVRVLSKQSKSQVGCISYRVISKGAEAIEEALQHLDASGKSLVIVDALNNEHLKSIALASVDMPLITGSSGLAVGLPDAYRVKGVLSSRIAKSCMPGVKGRTAILSGSCSAATQQQLAFIQSLYPTCSLDVRKCVADPNAVVDETVRWAAEQDEMETIVVASIAEAKDVETVQRELGAQKVANAVESVLATIAKRLVDECGARRLIVAGGETSGAVVAKLAVHTLRIGPRIAPGVPWTESIDGPPLALALKSGNFGGSDFFQRAVEMLSL